MKQANETFEAEITKVKKQKNELEAREKNFRREIEKMLQDQKDIEN